MKREEKEDVVRKNLEEFKSPWFEKLSFECSTSSTVSDLNYKCKDMSVGTELRWHQLVFNHMYSIRNWLNWRYQISEDSLEWMTFLFTKKIKTYRHCKGCQGEFLTNTLKYWKTTFDDITLSWVHLKPRCWIIPYQLRRRKYLICIYVPHF